MISIVIIDPDDETRAATEAFLRASPDFQVVGAAATGRAGLNMVEQLQPYIVVIEPDLPDMNGFELMQTISRRHVMTGLITFSRLEGIENLRQAMLSGAHYSLRKASDRSRLPEAIRDVEKKFNRQQEFAPQPKYKKHMVIVCSAKDGSGTTTLAINLAYGLTQKTPRTLLIDADLPFGDMGAYIAALPDHALDELVAGGIQLDAAGIDALTYPHHAGLKMILAPQSLTEAMPLSRQKPTTIAGAIRHAAQFQDICVVDAGSHLNLISALLSPAAHLVLVVNPNVASVKHAHAMLGWLRNEPHLTSHSLSVVLNKASSWKPGPTAPRPDALPTEQIEWHLKPNAIIPRIDDRDMFYALNSGTPLLALKTRRPPMNYPFAEFEALRDHVYNALSGAGQAG